MTVMSENESGDMQSTSESRPINVMVVDDSAVVRGLFTRSLESDPNIKVHASAANGEVAIRLLEDNLQKSPTDVIVLDIEMPVMDGITALPKLLAVDSKVKVIVASTLTHKNADVTLNALQKGATDCLAKPSTTRDLSTAEDFRRDLVQRVKALGLTVQRARGLSPVVSAQTQQPTGIGVPASGSGKSFSLHTGTVVKRPSAIVIGSSTGGPQALFNVLNGFAGKIQQPIFLTQHMPETFTSILAQHITRQTGLECEEAKDGEVVKGGKVHLAPGGYHMVIERQGVDIVTRLNTDAPENYCRPAVDPMLRSVMNIYDSSILAVILTGMGQDGKNACVDLVQKGGMCLTQDEETSVVWGMPGAVAQAGICFDVLPLNDIGPRVVQIANM
jgi:two-component system chemotaxis response regulator CheB